MYRVIPDERPLIEATLIDLASAAAVLLLALRAQSVPAQCIARLPAMWAASQRRSRSVWSG